MTVEDFPVKVHLDIVQLDIESPNFGSGIETLGVE
jgi:hypothetical protein